MLLPFISKPIKNPPSDPYLDWIKFGTTENVFKKYEGRLQNKIIEWNLKIGSRIKFYDQDNPESWVLVEVTGLPTFSDFGAAFDALGQELIPERTREQVIALYNGLFHYPDENLDKLNKENATSRMIREMGVVAIGFSVIILEPILFM